MSAAYLDRLSKSEERALQVLEENLEHEDPAVRQRAAVEVLKQMRDGGETNVTQVVYVTEARSPGLSDLPAFAELPAFAPAE